MTNTKSIDSFIEQFPPDVQTILQKIRNLVQHEAPEAEEAFSAFTTHIGLYPTPSVIVAFKKELVPYKTAKGSIQFSLIKPIPYDLIRRITQYRIANL